MMSRNDTTLFQRGICRNNAHAMATNTTMVMHSCITLSCMSVKRDEPMRLAGTWNRYSKKARAQLAAIAIQSGACLTFRCPYHASVMKIFEMMSKIAVIIFILAVVPRAVRLRALFVSSRPRRAINRRQRLSSRTDLGRFKTTAKFVLRSVAARRNRRASLEDRHELLARVRGNTNDGAVIEHGTFNLAARRVQQCFDFSVRLHRRQIHAAQIRRRRLRWAHFVHRLSVRRVCNCERS